MENTQDKQYQRMTQTPVGKLIVSLSIPTIISMLVTNIYNMADTYFVGTIGTSASAATGIVFGLMAILQAFGFMFGHGAGSNIARQLGRRDLQAAKEYASTSFYGSIFVGIVIMILGILFMDPFMRLLGSTDTILPYARTYALFILIAGPAMTSGCVMNNILRYEGKAVFAMVGLATGGILNIFLDYITVVLLQMGILGAGLATAISQYISMAILIMPYLQNKTQSSFHIKDITKDIHVLGNIVATGMPSLARQGLNSVSTMVLNGCAGLYGDAAVAAISIVNRIVNFLFCLAVGIGQGFQPVSAFNYGAGLYQRVKDGFMFAFKLGTILMVLLSIVSFVNAPSIVQFFRDDIEVMEIGIIAMRFQCVSLVLMPITMYGNMLFQSIGKSTIATFLATLRSGLVLIPLTILLVYVFGLTGLEMSQSISEILSAIISIPFIVYFFKHTN